MPFKGNADLTQALLGGHVMAQSDASGWDKYVDGGQMRLLVTFGEKRTKRWPTVPTATELGYGVVSTSPYGLCGPKGMDPAVVKTLHDAFKKAMDDPKHLELLAQLSQGHVVPEQRCLCTVGARHLCQGKALHRKARAGGQMNAAAADPTFRTLPDLVREHAAARPAQPALVQGDSVISYGELDALMDRVAAALQRDGLRPGDAIAACAHSGPHYAAVFLGALRAGVVVAPLAPSVTPEQFGSMLRDAQAKLLFADAAAAPLLRGGEPPTVALNGTLPGRSLDDWLAPPGTRPAPLALQPDWPFNIIYSSGTTGTPKGIVQSHGMRWTHVMRGAAYGYGPQSVTLLSTPLYSNTTLVVFLPIDGLWRHGVPDGQVRRCRLRGAGRDSCASRTPCWCRCSTSASWRCRTSIATT